jgi:hypothetical protein
MSWQFPQGIEVLVKKASVDPEFKALLLAERAGAAEAIGLELEPAEAAMLAAVPAAQLETIIGRTSVPSEHRRVFLGKVAAAMLAAVALTTPGCSDHGAVTGSRPPEPPPHPSPAGADPGLPEDLDPAHSAPPDQPSEEPATDQVTRGIRPDRVPQSEGEEP